MVEWLNSLTSDYKPNTTDVGLSPNTYQNSWVGWLVGIMVFNTTFNYISVISWRSVLLVEETAYCCIEYTSP